MLSHARSITFQGRLNQNNSSATPVSGTVTFHTKVLTPSDAADSCVFYDEKQSAVLSADGLFTINVGAGSVHGAALFTDLESGIVNSGQFAFAGSQCTSGNPYPYTPAKTATRQVQISFIDPVSNVEESLPPITLNPTGYAMDAGSVGGTSYTNILRLDNSGTPAANTISSSDFTKLVALIAGTSNQYSKQAASGNAVIPGHTGAFSSTPQAGEIWFDTSDQTLKYATNSSGGVAALGTAAATSVSSVSGAAGAGIVASPTTGAVVLSLAPIAPTAPTGSYGGSGKSASITVDQYGRVTAASEVSTGAVPASGSLGNYLKYTAGGWTSAPIEVTDLKKTGDASTNLFTDTMCPANKSLSLDSGSGTFKCQAIAGLSPAAFDTATASAVNAAANATSANTASAIVARDGSGNIAASYATLSSVILKDSGSNAITVKAPATSASYNFTLPNSAGSNSQVLTTDGSGNLSWGTPAPGGVVTASAPLVVTSGNIAINSANTSQSGALSAADWNTFNSKQGALGFTPVNKAGDSMTGPLTLPSNGLIVGINQLVVNGTKVGIGTATSLTTLDVAGNIKIGASAETCDASHAGMMHYNAPNLEYCDGGTSWKPLGVAGSGVTSINSDTSSSHTLSADTVGSSLSYTNSSGSHVLHIPLASATSGSAGGLVSNTDYTSFAGKLSSALASAKIFVGNAGGTATPVTMSGDVTIDNSGATTVGKIGTVPVSTASPADGKILRYDSSGTAGFKAQYLTMEDIHSLVTGGNFLTAGCSSSQTLTWNSGSDSLTCQNISISGSNLTGILPLASGGTNANLSSVNGGIAYSTATAMAFSAAGSAGQILRSAGSGAPTWSTASYPASAGAAGRMLRSDGTNFLSSSATFPDSATTGSMLYGSATNVWSTLNSQASSALVSDASGIPSWAAGSTANRLLRTNGTSVSFSQANLATDVTGTLPTANGGTGVTSAAQNSVFAGPTSGSGAPAFRALSSADISGAVTGSGTAGKMPYFSAAFTLADSPISISGGNVGIGITGPTQALDIGGNISMSGGRILMNSGSAGVVIGNTAVSTGNYNISLGINSSAAGSYDAALGFGNSTTGAFTSRSSVGVNNVASGDSAQAFGFQNTVSAANASAFGSNITNSIAGSTMIGPSNTSKLTILTNGNFGIGTTAPGASLDVVGHIANSSTGIPTVTACGTSPTIVGNDTRGTITSGTGSPASCTLNFSVAYATVPFCVIGSVGSTTAKYSVSAASTTSITIVGSFTATSNPTYICMQ